MTRTDENGRELEHLLQYVLQGVTAQEIESALGVSRTTYYRRKGEDDYPNAEELRIIARHFDLNPVDLMVRFGLVTADEAAGGGGIPLLTAPAAASRTAVTPRRVDALRGPSSF